MNPRRGYADKSQFTRLLRFCESLLNGVPYVPYVPSCLRCWCALVPSCPRAQIFGVPSCHRCWRALVPSCPRAQIFGVPSCLPCWRALVPSCPRAQTFSVPSCLRCWRALAPKFSACPRTRVQDTLEGCDPLNVS